MLRLALGFIASLTLWSLAFAEEIEVAAPYGFVWGESAEDVTSRYGSLEFAESNDYVESFLISDLPEGAFPPDTFSVRVEFSRDGGLEAIKVKSSTFSDDDEGTEARRLFSAQVDKLIETLGEGEVLAVGPREPWPATDQFYQCALDGMCGFLKAYWAEGCTSTYVVLEFVPEQRRVGHFIITYVDPKTTSSCK